MMIVGGGGVVLFLLMFVVHSGCGGCGGGGGSSGVVVVFTLNRSFAPTKSAHPVSVLILHPREINIWVTYCGKRERKYSRIFEENVSK